MLVLSHRRTHREWEEWEGSSRAVVVITSRSHQEECHLVNKSFQSHLKKVLIYHALSRQRTIQVSLNFKVIDYSS